MGSFHITAQTNHLLRLCSELCSVDQHGHGVHARLRQSRVQERPGRVARVVQVDGVEVSRPGHAAGDEERVPEGHRGRVLDGVR